MDKNYLITLYLVWIVCFNLVTTKSPGVSLTLPALFKVENFPGRNVGCQPLNCRAVLRELNYTEKVPGRLFALFLESVTGVNNV
jgi:hypothetical protein